jgi:hypothetical protein
MIQNQGRRRDGPYPSIQSHIHFSEAQFTGNWLPQESLARFDGEMPNGTWYLRLQDSFSGDGGSVRAFSLIITTCPGPGAVNPFLWSLIE